MKSKVGFIVLLNHSSRLKTSGKHFCLEKYLEKIHAILWLRFMKTALLNLSMHQALSNKKLNKPSLRIVFDSTELFFLLLRKSFKPMCCVKDVMRN